MGNYFHRDIKKTMPVIACLDKTVMAVGSDCTFGRIVILGVT